ncbi:MULTISPECIES: TetR/AcrR family transcriptional regulator [unclassified Lentimicrobium]|uniref:TetR/AcrR family transcriptional regulator n=1 Tax=unclassified Lentimicrobium TaxID=2677434 RepID=UPI00155651F0|nr:MULTISPECIES: TetR/AcrR family transcriptional regulator [unclassified Lentimicrobium]NPD44058.1 TetR/AcrR family transcriptional regulator [Lentimicrobium sp. S6]NPD85910.1 TetR/AcrR family transcriptional regulator [Lentimicrobium sp. L6]
MRNEKHNKSYKTLLETAKPLFWKYGVKRVSVEEICKEAKVSKMTFYRHFKNKNELALEIMLKIFDKGLLDYRQVMAQDIPFVQKIEEIISLKFQNTQDVSEEFIKDIYVNGDITTQKMIEEYSETMLLEFKQDLANAQKKGWIRKDIKIEFIMKMRDQITQLLNDDSFLAIYKTPQEAIMEVTRFFFYGLMNSEEAKS